ADRSTELARFVELNSHVRSRSTDALSWERLSTRSSRPSTLRVGSWSVSRSSRAGCSASRAPTSTISRLRASELDAPHAQEGILTRRGGEHPLAAAVEGVRRHLAPLGLAPEANETVAVRLGAWIPRGDQRGGLAAVDQPELSGHPHDVAQIRWRFER